MTNTSDAEPGSRLVQEITLLLELIAERVGPWLDRVAVSTHDEHATWDLSELGFTGPESLSNSRGWTWCPLCAIVAVVKGEPNELASTTMDRLAQLIALLRAVLADRWEPGSVHMPGFRPPRKQSRPAGRHAASGDRAAWQPSTEDSRPPEGARPRVQHIPIRRG